MATAAVHAVKSVEARVEELQIERAMECGDAFALAAHPLFQDAAFMQVKNALSNQMGVHHA